MQEGYYWYNKSVVKAFDKEGNLHKLYRLKVNNDLSMSYSKPCNGYSQFDAKDMMSWSELVNLKQDYINDLEQNALNLIQDKLDKYSNYTPIIPVSTGKDSMTVLHLVRQLFPYAKAIFNNTSLDCAEVYRMAKTIPHCQIMSPKQGFYPYIKEHNKIPTPMARFCCGIYKSGVMTSQLDKDAKYLLFMGMRNSESAKRKDYTDEVINPEWGQTNWIGILPIRKWSDLDVWLYMLSRNISINDKYKKGYSRVGCAIACPYYTKSVWTFDEYYYPEMRKRWLDILRTYFINNKKWAALNCTIEEFLQKGWNGYGIYRDEPTEEVIDEMQQYTGITDKETVMKYFNNTCNKCGKRLKKDEIALSMKFFNNNTFYCYDCMSKGTGLSKKELKETAKGFKNNGCVLF